MVSCATKPEVQVTPTTDYAKTFRDVARGAVMVEVSSKDVSGGGSGTVIWTNEKQALVLTCDHVVLNELTGKTHDKFVIIGPDGDRVMAQVQDRQKAHDMALLLTLGALNVKALKIAKEEPNVYDKLLLVASPDGYRNTAAEGTLSAKSRDSFLGEYWQVTSFIFPGSSGGTVANTAGELVGIPRAVHNTMFGILPEIGFCIPLSHIQSFLRGYKL